MQDTEDMSVCLESSSTLAHQASSEKSENKSTTSFPDEKEPDTAEQSPNKNKATNTSNSNSLITVVNTPGPVAIVKSINSSYSTNHFTLVNSSPLTVSNGLGKQITVVPNPPYTLVRPQTNETVPITVIQSTNDVTKTTNSLSSTICNVTPINGSVNSVVEKPAIHNVFVKNSSVPETTSTNQPVIPQAQKLLTANTFSQNNIIQNLNTSVATAALLKSGNGQKSTQNSNKLKILSNVVVPGSNSISGPTNLGNNPNFVVNKTTTPVKYYPQQKLVTNANGATKLLNKPAAPAVIKTSMSKTVSSTKPQKMIYSAQKGHIKTMPPLNNLIQKQNIGLKTISPQYKGIPNQQVQRTSSGLKTIPPQRSPKSQNKPNYIGKHAIQGQKMRSPMGSHKVKTMKPVPSSYVSHADFMKMPQNNQTVYTQALTAQIIETLNQNNSSSYGSNRSRDTSLRYDGNYTYSNSAPTETPEASRVSPRIIDQKPQSGLDTLSLICQAVLLDHNYNATLPLEPVTRPSSCNSTSPLQINGAPNGSLYSPGSGTRGRSSLASSNSTSIMSTSSSTLVASMSSSGLMQDDDVASDISCGSERRPETEGEETDTAPEAEAVTNNDIDHYGDYVNRCICGFDHDDGYMIECDRCKVWQHVRCVVKTKKVPDDFLCEVCDPTKVVDRAKARLLQQQYLKDRGDPRFQKDLRLQQQQKIKETLSDTDSSDGEPSIGNNVINKGRTFTARKRELHKNNLHQRRDRGVNRRPVKQKEKKMTKRKTKSQSRQQQQQQQHQQHSDDENQDSWGQASQLPQLRQWIENYEEAVTNHYSPELRARISNIRINGAHSDLPTQVDSAVHKCRVQVQPLTGLKFLVSTMSMPPNTPVIELRGKYMLSTQHRSSVHTGMLTTRQHSQRPGPFLFFYRLHKDSTEVCVDTRTYGNDARFIRRSCKPNSELRHCIEKGVLHLYIVTIVNVEKNIELTIKHESHDLAVVGTTYITCACGKPEECTVNKTAGAVVKKNGENIESTNHRKRRGRRTISTTSDHDNTINTVTTKLKEEKHQPIPSPPAEIKVEVDIKQEKEEKKESVEDVKIKIEDIKQEPPPEQPAEAPAPEKEKEKEKVEIKQEETEEEEEEEEDEKEKEAQNQPPPISTRRSSHHLKSESSEEKSKEQTVKEAADKKKLSREERKIEAIMKAFERMEKQQQRKQEHQAKQAHRRESDPVPPSRDKDEEKTDQKMKRRRRKGRARTTSTNSQRRSNRVNSADSSYATSGDEALLSPNSDNNNHNQTHVKESSNSPDKAAGLLLALANGDNSSHRNEPKSPVRDADSSSNSVHSSPETPLSSACLLVAAAVEPLEPGFKFPKTKKGLMNEWLNKSPECIQSASSISPSSLTPHITPPPECSFYENSNFYNSTSKSLGAFPQTTNYCDTSQPHGSAKKRWLRQAISEDQCESPIRADSPPLSETVAPPKKRKLPRESLSNDASPPTTPTNSNAPMSLACNDNQTAEQEGRVEIVLSGTDEDSPSTVLESDAILKKRAAEMQQEFGKCVRLSESQENSLKDLSIVTTTSSRLCTMDPRLSRHVFNNSDHLVGTVEKTLSIFGFQDRKPDPMPAKRKLSIMEYRQRKKLTTEKVEEKDPKTQENNSTSSFTMPPMRRRSDSASSATSFMSSDEELHPIELPQKSLSAFNSEPTELEKTRENVSLRLKKAFGLSVDEDARKPTLIVDSLLNCNLSISSKTNVPLVNPTFPIPGSSEPNPPPPSPPPPPPVLPPEPEEVAPPPLPQEPEMRASPPPPPEEEQAQLDPPVKPEMFYTPDDEETKAEGEDTDLEESSKMEKYKEVESTSYVPPFNNPLYPNSSSFSYGSVIDDDAPYEGRNPSPPPELNNSVPSSYSAP